MNFIQKIAMIGALGEGFFQDAFLAGALNKVSDFEIVFEFDSQIYVLPQTDGSYFAIMFCNKQQKKSSLKPF